MFRRRAKLPIHALSDMAFAIPQPFRHLKSQCKAEKERWASAIIKRFSSLRWSDPRLGRLLGNAAEHCRSLSDGMTSGDFHKPSRANEAAFGTAEIPPKPRYGEPKLIVRAGQRKLVGRRQGCVAVEVHCPQHIVVAPKQHHRFFL